MLVEAWQNDEISICPCDIEIDTIRTCLMVCWSSVQTPVGALAFQCSVVLLLRRFELLHGSCANWDLLTQPGNFSYTGSIYNTVVASKPGSRRDESVSLQNLNVFMFKSCFQSVRLSKLEELIRHLHVAVHAFVDLVLVSYLSSCTLV